MAITARRIHVHEMYRQVWEREINGRRYVFLAVRRYDTLPGYVKVFLDDPALQRYFLIHAIRTD